MQSGSENIIRLNEIFRFLHDITIYEEYKSMDLFSDTTRTRK